MAAQLASADSDRRQSAALSLTNGQIRKFRRLGCVSLLITAAGVALCLWLQAELPDLLLSVFAIGGLVALTFATIGRLPSGFEIAGLDLSFERDDLETILAMAEDDFSDDQMEVLYTVLYKWIPETEVEAARQRVVSRPLESVGQELRIHRDFDKEIENVADTGTVRREFNVKGTGQGKPPKLDYFFRFGDRGVGVVTPNLDNATVVELTRKRVERTLTAGNVDAVLIAVPTKFVPAYETLTFENRHIAVMSTDDATSDLRASVEHVLK